MPEATPDERAAAQQYAAQRLQLDLEPLQRALAAAYGDAYTAGALAGAQQTGATVVAGAGGLSVPDDWPMFWDTWQPGNHPAAAQLADGGLKRLLDEAQVSVRGIADTTLDRFGSILADGAANGDSVDVIAGRLNDYLTDPERAFQIADTETARAVTAASLEQYTASGVAQAEWLVSPGACDECQSYAAAGPYEVTLAPALPAHPVCRCSYAPLDPTTALT